MSNKWLWATIVALVWVPIAIGLVVEWRKRVLLRRAVFASLDEAMGTGINYVGVAWSADEIALDMTICAPGFIGDDPVTLVPYICEWLRERDGT